MADDAPGALNVSMFAPWHARCGIRDYAAHLIKALDDLPEIATTRLVAAPPDAVRADALRAVTHYRRDAARFRALGQSMNAAADIAHIQHQYFLFGGVAPYKTHILSFLNALTIPAVMTVHEAAASRPGILRALAVGAANWMNFVHPKLLGMIVHTESDRQQLQAVGVAPDRLHLIRHGVPAALPMQAPDVIRPAWELEHPGIKGRRVVTLFGFLSVKKGHRIALDALSQMPDDVALIFAGDQHPDDHTPYVASLRAEIANIRPADRVIITGYVPSERLPEIMALTDVAVAPFLQSSGSGSLANLLAYGRAVVASDIAPHRELMTEQSGLLSLVPAGSSERLAAAVSELLDDAARRETLQRAALAYAARHSYTQMARETVQVYRAVLAAVH